MILEDNNYTSWYGTVFYENTNVSDPHDLMKHLYILFSYSNHIEFNLKLYFVI